MAPSAARARGLCALRRGRNQRRVDVDRTDADQSMWAAEPPPPSPPPSPSPPPTAALPPAPHGIRQARADRAAAAEHLFRARGLEIALIEREQRRRCAADARRVDDQLKVLGQGAGAGDETAGRASRRSSPRAASAAPTDAKRERARRAGARLQGGDRVEARR